MHKNSFPNGLIQPPGAARFGADALLLAAFAYKIVQLSSSATGTIASPVVELGCGCGAACLALAGQGLHIIGLEREHALLAAARMNARNLGVQKNATFYRTDLNLDINLRQLSGRLGAFSLIIANPPWHNPHAIRLSPSLLRNAAYAAADINYFCPAASAMLLHHGYYCLIVPSGSLTRLFQCLAASHLGARKILPIAPGPGKDVKRLLVLARKNARDDLQICSPLYLHNEDGSFSTEACDFCPWLGRRQSWPGHK